MTNKVYIVYTIDISWKRAIKSVHISYEGALTAWNKIRKNKIELLQKQTRLGGDDTSLKEMILELSTWTDPEVYLCDPLLIYCDLPYISTHDLLN